MRSSRILQCDVPSEASKPVCVYLGSISVKLDTTVFREQALSNVLA